MPYVGGPKHGNWHCFLVAHTHKSYSSPRKSKSLLTLDNEPSPVKAELA